MSTPHIVSIVFNSVTGDSRVIKTAKAAMNAGHRATLVGVSTTQEVQEIEIEGVQVLLVPHRAKQLARRGLWGGEKRDIRLIAGSYLKEVLPRIVALKPDIIHSHDMVGVKVGAMALKAMTAEGISGRWIHDIHEFVAGLKGAMQEQYIPACTQWESDHFGEADHLITVSDALADEIANRYSVRRPTVTLNTPYAGTYRYAGPDIRSALSLSNDIPLVVFVGGASALRGCDIILEAVANIPNIHFAMISQGAYVDELSKKAASIGMGPRFHVHPYVASDKVTTFIRTADIGIHGLKHYPNAEVAMPNKMFEYLHAGIPVVVSDVKSMMQFVEREKIGCTFIADNAESCKTAILRSLDRGKVYKQNITEELKAIYSWETQEIKLKNIYEELLSMPKLTPSKLEQARAASIVKAEYEAHEKRVAAAAEDSPAITAVNTGQRSSTSATRRVFDIVRREGICAGTSITWSALRRRLFHK